MSVDVKSEGLLRLVDENVEVEQLATGFTFTEGPIWNPAGQFLLFSDMPGDTRRRWDEQGGIQEVDEPEQQGQRDDPGCRRAADRLRALDERRSCAWTPTAPARAARCSPRTSRARS